MEVNETLRRKFESDWACGTPGELAEYLPPADAGDYLPTLEELVCIDLEFRWHDLDSGADSNTPNSRHGSTEVPNADSNVGSSDVAFPYLESYLERFPELRDPERVQRLVDQEILVRARSPFPPRADEYLSRFPELGLTDALQRLAAEIPTLAAANSARRKAEQDLPRPFGSYQLLSLLGKGGMGAVYEATHGESARIVALKLTDIQSLPPSNRIEMSKRMAKEARASARLRHDHLVPVYDVGIVDSTPYYTMPVFDSDLANEIRRGPLEPRLAAKYLAQAADGIQVAHEGGLLHRDVKPHNMMLDRDLDRVLVSDFGLARLQTDTSDLTRSGNLLGTPAYMAPEQIKNPKTVDERADVYSLGATLYHLLTGRPPLTASEPTEVLRQVLQDDPVSPRELIPTISRDLETICMRCLHKEPQLRYESAQALSEDLRCYLADKPIVARPLSLVGRLGRWRRRKPAIAAAAMALFVAMWLVIGLSIATYRENRRFLAENQRFLAGIQQGERSIDDLFTFFRASAVFRQPGNEGDRREMLQRALAHYEMYLRLSQNNKQLLVSRFNAQVSIAALVLELDGPEPAQECLRKAIDFFEEMPASVASDKDAQVALGDAWNLYGQSFHRLERTDEASDAFDKSIEIRERLVAESPDNLEMPRKLANALSNRGLIFTNQTKYTKAEKDFRDADEIRSKLLSRNDTTYQIERDNAQGQYNMARLAMARKRWNEAERGFANATQQFERLTKKHPTYATVWRRLVECLVSEVELQFQKGQSGNLSAEKLANATDWLRRLCMLAPDNRGYRIEMVDLCHHVVELLLSDGNDASREASRNLAMEGWTIAEDELFVHFDSSDQQTDIGLRRCYQRRLEGLIAMGNDKLQQARTCLKEALEQWDSVRDPESAEHSVREDADWKNVRLFLRSR